MYDYENDQVVPDRLGCKLFIMKKGMVSQFVLTSVLEYETQLADAEVLFHNLSLIENQLST